MQQIQVCKGSGDHVNSIYNSQTQPIRVTQANDYKSVVWIIFIL